MTDERVDVKGDSAAEGHEGEAGRAEANAKQVEPRKSQIRREGRGIAGTAIGSLVIALASFGLAYASFLESRPTAQLERNQDRHMKLVADEVLLYMFLLSNIMDAPNRGVSEEYVDVGYNTIQSHAQRLDETLSEGVTVGLLPYMAGDYEGALVEFIDLEIILKRISLGRVSESDSGIWITLRCFLARLANQCIKYRVQVFERDAQQTLIEPFIDGMRELDCRIR